MSNKLFLSVLLTSLLAGCVTSTPVLYEEAANPNSTSRRIVAHQIRRWTTRPVTKFEKRFDFNGNGRLDPDELLRFRMASGYYQKYGGVWKFDKNKDWKFDQEEYYDATRE
ncbi:MAG TPA: hypothetical protein VLJ37_12390 [bacterium]|nr:hypothetical protein [bacterium]